MALARVVSLTKSPRIAFGRWSLRCRAPSRGGLPAKEIIVLHDADANKSVVIVFFESEEDYQRRRRDSQRHARQRHARPAHSRREVRRCHPHGGVRRPRSRKEGACGPRKPSQTHAQDHHFQARADAREARAAGAGRRPGERARPLRAGEQARRDRAGVARPRVRTDVQATSRARASPPGGSPGGWTRHRTTAGRGRALIDIRAAGQAFSDSVRVLAGALAMHDRMSTRRRLADARFPGGSRRVARRDVCCFRSSPAGVSVGVS